jgi:hypothetical protein
VSCGFDAARGHPAPLGGYDVSPACFAHMTRALMQHAHGKVKVNLKKKRYDTNRSIVPRISSGQSVGIPVTGFLLPNGIRSSGLSDLDLRSS